MKPTVSDNDEEYEEVLSRRPWCSLEGMVGPSWGLYIRGTASVASHHVVTLCYQTLYGTIVLASIVCHILPCHMICGHHNSLSTRLNHLRHFSCSLYYTLHIESDAAAVLDDDDDDDDDDKEIDNWFWSRRGRHRQRRPRIRNSERTTAVA